jgi:hypothetical protein
MTPRVNCSYPDRDAAIVAYLYDDDGGFAAAERVSFETHVMTCEPCRTEVSELGRVRSTLSQWATPETTGAVHESFVRSHQPTSWWHSVPVWAQVAAAMLVLGVSASIANLDIRYDRVNGLNVRTGWSKVSSTQSAGVAPAVDADAALWHAELSAVQKQLRGEIRAQLAKVSATSAAAAPPAMSDAQLQQSLRALLDESEQKQEQTLALHLAQLQRDFGAQRQADIRRTNELVRALMSTYDDHIAKQQRQIDYLLPNPKR